jgi:DNA-binding response OmpR family regulator
MSATILVLEDDEAMGRLIRRRLKAAGHRVRVFAHAGTALDEIDDGATFDLYLLDVTMPVGATQFVARWSDRGRRPAGARANSCDPPANPARPASEDRAPSPETL